MIDQDLPHLDDSIIQLPKDVREDLAYEAMGNLFVFAQVCGFHDLHIGCHGPVCVFHDHNPKKFKLILMPRDCLKTSLIGIAGNLKRVAANSESRILIINETAGNAAHMMRGIRQIVEGNRVFRSLFSSMIPQDTKRIRWNDSELDFPRQGHYPEPTITAMGIDSAVTSRHYTHINPDDLISQEAIKSPLVMNNVIQRMSGFLNLLVDESSTITWVGTRWALFDVYVRIQQVYGTQLALLIRSIIEDGEIIWPYNPVTHKGFTPERLALLRAEMGEYLYSCNMMNSPRNEELQDLNVDDLMWYRWRGERTVELMAEDGQTVIDSWDLIDLDITTTVDLAPSETIKADRNAISTVGVSPKRQVIVLDAWAERGDPDKVIEHLFWLKERFAPRAFGIEDVGYQKALKWVVRTKAKEREVYLNVVPVKPGGRGKPHVRGLQPIMAARRMFMDPAMHLLRNEMADFPLGRNDDAVDALALQLQLLRGAMSPQERQRNEERRKDAMRKLLGPQGVEDKVDEELFEPKPRRSGLTREYTIA